jgi:hypothetical protein
MAVLPARQARVRPAVPAADRQARPSVAAARKARVPQEAELRVVRRLVARRLEQPAGWDAAAAEQEALRVPQALAAQPLAAEAARAELGAAAGPQRGAVSVAAAEPGVAAVVPRRAAERALVEVPLPGVAAVPVAEELPRAARGVQVGRPSGAAWAAALCLQAARLAPSPPAQSAHAREDLRIARR